SRLRRRVVECRDPEPPAELPGQFLRGGGITDEIGVRRHAGNQVRGTIYLQMIRPECQGWPPTSRARGEQTFSIFLTSSGVSGASVSRLLVIEVARDAQHACGPG